MLEGGRHIDENTGLIFPWYTKPFLDELIKWDLSDKVVFEFGMGDSSLWWAKKCKRLYGVESNKEWVGDGGVHNDKLLEFDNDWNPIDTLDPELYINAIFKCDCKLDIVIIDGLDREDCVEPAIKSLKKCGIIIYDNWMQSSVCVQSEKTQKRLLAFEHYIYQQPGHDDWKTAYFII